MKRTSRLLRNRNRSRAPAGQPARVGPAPPPAPPVAAAALIDPTVGQSERVTLARAKAQWLVGDWEALAALDPSMIATHPQRDRLALLAACAHLQCDQAESATELLRLALHWGCDARLAARLLVSGVHNTLGRAAALGADTPALESHFGAALALTGDPDGKPAAYPRAVRELARLGLLPQATGLLQARVDGVDAAQGRPMAVEAELTMLRSSVELLQHELSIALQRDSTVFEREQPAAAATPGADADPTTRWRRLATSQLGQDLWVLERSGFKHGGFFVEFGATDGVRLSNTYLLEKHFGWSGICCEPNPRMFPRLKANRACHVSPACVGARSGERVEFVLADEYGGMARDMGADMHADKRAAYASDPANRIEVETLSLDDLLSGFDAPRQIDYLSIDTEGSEYSILAAFPFDRWRIRLITVEHNFSATREPIRELLEGHGYRRTEARWDDWYELA